MTKAQHTEQPCFRLKFPWESAAFYKIEKENWQESMIRCGLLTRRAVDAERLTAKQ